MNFQVVNRLFRSVFLEWRWGLAGVVLTTLLSFLAWAGPQVIAGLIDEGITPRNSNRVFEGCAWLLVVEVLRHASSIGAQIAFSRMGQNVIERVRSSLIGHLLKLPTSYFDRVSSGSMMTRVVNDANSLTDFFQSGFVSILGNVASIVAVWIGLFGLDTRLAFPLLIVFFPSVIACGFFSERLRKVYENARNQMAYLNSVLADFLFGMKTIRSLGLSDLKRRRLNRQIQKYAEAQKMMVKTFALFHPAYTLGTGLMLLVWIGLGLERVNEATLPMGAWVAGLAYIMALQAPLIEISDRWNFFLAGITSFSRIDEVLGVRPERQEGESAPHLKSLEFKGVEFRYEDSPRRALQGVQFQVDEGQKVGVFGESGSGKSTLLQLMYGFYAPQAGSLQWNHAPFEQWSLSSIRKQFGVVEQFPFLFSGTIEENITFFGRHPVNWEAWEDQFREYLQISQLIRLRSAWVHERGTNLSMGQRQLIAFLRAMAQSPSIWVLDEATAFFDPEAEKEVMRAMSSIAGKATWVQVAHRPEAMRTVDRAYRVVNGKLEEWAP